MIGLILLAGKLNFNFINQCSFLIEVPFMIISCIINNYGFSVL